MLTACGGKGSEKQGDIPTKRIPTRGDSIALAARFTGDFGQSIEGRINGCDYLVAAHRYSEASDNYIHLDQFIKDWGYDYNLETIGRHLLPKLRANYNAGRKDSALHVAMQISEVYDTSLALGIVAVLVLAFALYIFLQWRITQRRNRILAQQISQAVEYKEKYRELKAATRAAETAKIEEAAKAPEQTIEELSEQVQDSKTVTETEVPEKENVGASISISDVTTITDEQLFLFLRDLIENEKLFLQPDFGRQSLIERTGLSKERIGAAFAQGSDSVSLPAYVRELRLDYAVRLMNSQPDLNVEQVSQASGFTSADTFTRNFRTKYGMTPTTYKQTNYHE